VPRSLNLAHAPGRTTVDGRCDLQLAISQPRNWPLGGRQAPNFDPKRHPNGVGTAWPRTEICRAATCLLCAVRRDRVQRPMFQHHRLLDSNHPTRITYSANWLSAFLLEKRSLRLDCVRGSTLWCNPTCRLVIKPPAVNGRTHLAFASRNLEDGLAHRLCVTSRVYGHLACLGCGYN